MLWRRERDLNPRYPYEVHTISSHTQKGGKAIVKSPSERAYNSIEAVFTTSRNGFRKKNRGIISRSSETEIDIDEPARKKARAAKHNKDFGDFAIINPGGRCAAVAEAVQDCSGNRKSGGTRFSLGNPTDRKNFLIVCISYV